MAAVGSAVEPVLAASLSLSLSLSLAACDTASSAGEFWCNGSLLSCNGSLLLHGSLSSFNESLLSWYDASLSSLIGSLLSWCDGSLFKRTTQAWPTGKLVARAGEVSVGVFCVEAVVSE